MKWKCRVLMVVLAMGIYGCSSVGTNRSRGPHTRSLKAAYRLSFDEHIWLDTASSPIRWRKGIYYPISLSVIEFHLDERSRLTAHVGYSTWAFDTVEYRVHGAVFSQSGELLGTTSAPVKVSRRWISGRVSGGTDQPLKLDFGQSLNYRNAKYFAVAISDRPVLTPDQYRQCIRGPGGAAFCGRLYELHR